MKEVDEIRTDTMASDAVLLELLEAKTKTEGLSAGA